jgi:hypothetical protein
LQWKWRRNKGGFESALCDKPRHSIFVCLERYGELNPAIPHLAKAGRLANVGFAPPQAVIP